MEDLAYSPHALINTAPPMLELSNVYGIEEVHALRYREGKGGRLSSERIRGKEWPTNGSSVCVNNESPNENRCHSTEAGANALLGINLIFLWLFRNHNYLADKLHELNPCWGDDKLYQVARDINIAMYQHIVYHELMPAVIGQKYLEKNKVIFPGHVHVDDYDEDLEPRLAQEYVLATRWFHVLQEGRINLYDKHGKMFNQLSVVDLSLRTGALTINNTIEGATQGAFRQACASTDYVIDPEMGERSLGRLQFVSDVMAADIMKTRDVGLPPYNRYRELCKLPVAEHFHDLYQWMPKEVRLQDN
ncbi:peroxidase-like [Ostrinia nubilalis]|uniref:peroxidase-like n=1 Tax=Ostrinia nubilalis TaxID=29057 RepID=UPI0030823133